MMEANNQIKLQQKGKISESFNNKEIDDGPLDISECSEDNYDDEKQPKYFIFTIKSG